ncbi:major facilitator transporter [Caballeronia sordidicola]|uniref:Major facilitator transporter n=2 Tax=Caballeronia sordidicola TaxID=196367 RepID=A0A158HQG2_CABSO|nr:major facilitator transporter [Caballeronia sordidicola]
MRFNWAETEYSYMVVVFIACYAIGLILSGKLVDKYGVKLGYGICVLVWSIPACGHSLVRNTLGFSFMRALLGLAESGNFPAAVKAVSEWFPRREQALAVGILTSGTSIGAVAAPALVPWLAASYGWQAAFLVTGLTGFVWLGFWYLMYYAPQKHKTISVEELKYINENRARDDEKGQSVSWISLLKIRHTWAFVMGKLLTDPIWWFMLFWLPSYFCSRYHLDFKNLGLPLVVVYVATSIGSISGGWLSSRLMARGWNVTRARQITMLGLAFLVVPIAFSPWIDNIWAIVGLLSLAAAARQGWSANLFTTASDMFPKRLVGSIVGMGGMAGAIGGTVFPLFVGALLDHFKALGNVNAGYNILFAICGSAYVIAWTIMRLIRTSNPRTDLGSMPADSVT